MTIAVVRVRGSFCASHEVTETFLIFYGEFDFPAQSGEEAIQAVYVENAPTIAQMRTDNIDARDVDCGSRDSARQIVYALPAYERGLVVFATHAAARIGTARANLNGP